MSTEALAKTILKTYKINNYYQELLFTKKTCVLLASAGCAKRLQLFEPKVTTTKSCNHNKPNESNKLKLTNWHINTELLDKPYIFSPRQDGIVTQKIVGWAPQQNHIHNCPKSSRGSQSTNHQAKNFHSFTRLLTKSNHHNTCLQVFDPTTSIPFSVRTSIVHTSFAMHVNLRLQQREHKCKIFLFQH